MTLGDAQAWGTCNVFAWKIHGDFGHCHGKMAHKVTCQRPSAGDAAKARLDSWNWNHWSCHWKSSFTVFTGSLFSAEFEICTLRLRQSVAEVQTSLAKGQVAYKTARKFERPWRPAGSIKAQYEPVSRQNPRDFRSKQPSVENPNTGSTAMTPEKCRFSIQIQRQKTFAHATKLTQHEQPSNAKTQCHGCKQARPKDAIAGRATIEYRVSSKTSQITFPAMFLDACNTKSTPNTAPAIKNEYKHSYAHRLKHTSSASPKSQNTPILRDVVKKMQNCSY